MVRSSVLWMLGSLFAGGVPRLPAQDLAQLVKAAEALGARTGVAVCDEHGAVLFRHRAAEAFAPASNMKLLTATAVLRGLGAEFEFVTRFELKAGRLVVTASGDPNWLHESPDAPERVFGAVAAALHKLGVRKLCGIDLLPGTFLGPTRPSTWPQDQLYAYYCAPTGPFVLEQGTFLLRLAANGGANAEARLIAPADAMPVEGTVALVDKAKDATYGAIDRGGRVQVRGRFPRRGSPVQIRTAVNDATQWYLAVLERCLQNGGVTIDAAAATATTAAVYEHRSALQPALLRMLEDSSNFDAEQCLRVLGAATRNDGSLAGGVAALAAELRHLIGALPGQVELVDGSGLSKQNRLTPGVLLIALVRTHNGAAGKLLRGCLPVAGQSGTMAERFVGTELAGRVRAKTGWIRGASALTGLVENRGRVRWFSILMNYDPQQNGLNKELKELQEKIVQAVDRLDASR